MPAREIDLRGFDAPEPMQRALALADALPPGGAVCVLTPRLPLPLLDALGGRGLQYRATLLDDGCARVWIGRPDDGVARA